jgi:large subunit ribosomal protein L22
MEAKATAKHVRMAPRKVRLVMDAIRGKYAQEALDMLRFTPNHAADEIANVIKSAVANAVNNHEMEGDYLKIARCWVDCGMTMKRMQPRAQGRAYRILKRTSHITVVVEEGTAPPTTRPRELEIKRKAKNRPPLRAALKTPEVAAAAPVEATATTEAAAAE